MFDYSDMKVKRTEKEVKRLFDVTFRLWRITEATKNHF